MRRFLSFLALALLLPAGLVRAQGLDIGLVTGNESALPIAVVPMPYLGTSVAPTPTSPRSSAPTSTARASSRPWPNRT